MKQFIGVLCFVITIAAVGANALLMLISPRLWFRFPQWIRLSGSLTAEKFSSGSGALQVRLLGAGFLAILFWFMHGCLSSHR
jgi:hypothetical protein